MRNMEEGIIFRDEIENYITRDEIKIFILLILFFETRLRLHIVLCMLGDENEKHRLNFSRSILTRLRILADLCSEGS